MTVRKLPRPEALRGVRLDRHAVVEASAGTGKTFTLEHLVVELLVAGASIEQILVVTFTEKATTELRLRVRARLEQLLLAGGPEERTGDEEYLAIDGPARARLERALHGYDGATISTIHAFCRRVLRENAFASGRLFEEQQVDGRDAFARVFRDVLRRDIAADPSRAPWLEAALAEGWSVSRLEDLLWRCLAARCELLPPFGLEASASLGSLLEELETGALRVDGAIVQLQRWGVRGQSARAITSKLRALADAVDRVRETESGVPGFVVAARKLDLGYLRESIPAGYLGPSPLGRACTNALALARATPSLAAAVAQTMLAPLRTELSRRKREAGQFDFDDMLTLVHEALSGPRGEALRASMRNRWRYALVDEFQDTDEIQWSILRRAFFEPGPRETVVFLVGDPKQSIYRFRGADVDTYLRARGEVLRVGGQPVCLARNYRATRDLVDATNTILDQRAPQPFFTGDVEYEPVTCGRPERELLDGEGRRVTPVHAVEFEGSVDLDRLGRFVAGEVRRITDPSRPWRLAGRPLTHSDVFVLTRKNEEARIVGAALRSAGVPHAFYKEEGLLQSDEAIEVRNLLAAIDDPDDPSRRASAWLTHFFDLPLADVDRARDLPSTHPFVARLAAWRALAEARDFGDLFEAIVVDSGVLRREIFFGDGERELTNYLHVFEVLLEHARQARVTLTDLVHLLSGLIDRTKLPLDMEGNVQRLESERRAVQIMTVHKAKGLEAPIVFLAGGFSPSRADEPRVFHANGRRCAWVGSPPAEVKSRAAEEEREDEQRLMYVALTRAMGRVYLPRVVNERETAKVRGAYEPVNRRLGALLAEGNGLVSVEPATAAGPEDPPGPANDTRPDAATLPLHLLLSDDGRDYSRLRAARVGTRVTSYTRMHAGLGRPHPAASVPEILREPAALRDEKVREEAEAGSGAFLRSARASGVFVHELLERVPLPSFAEANFESWRTRRDVSAVFEEALVVHRVDVAQRAHAEELVWRAYTTGIELPRATRIESIGRARRVMREMDFVFPVPGTRVFVRGSLDLAFEHGGLTYFADWKTDLRADYMPAALGPHVREHYDEQVRLYSLAVVRLLGLANLDAYEARFGGLLYCFLRGMDASGTGVWVARPTWEEVSSWEQWLQAQASGPVGSEA